MANDVTYTFTATVPSVVTGNAPTVYQVLANELDIEGDSYVLSSVTGDLVAVFPLGTAIVRTDSVPATGGTVA